MRALLAAAALAALGLRLMRRARRRNPRRRPRALPPPPRHAEVATALDRCAPRAPPAAGRGRDCTFCLERADSAGEVRVTACEHVFHAACLEEWVFYAADRFLDWRQYCLGDDGTVEATVSPPSCPNCARDLCVVPEPLVRTAILTSIARSLSLRDLVAAAEMYDAGLVGRDLPPVRARSTEAPRHAQRSVLPARVSGDLIALAPFTVQALS